MTAGFAGSTAAYYRSYRRDVPPPVLHQLAQALGLSSGDRVVDVGTGTGQVAVPLSRVVGAVLAVDPEPDMLAQLRQRLTDDDVHNVLPVLAAGTDLPVLTGALGPGSVAAVTIANALHWLDAEAFFADAAPLLRPGGGLAVITHGVPMWLVEADWARRLRAHLETWIGPIQTTCDSDAAALQARRHLLGAAGYQDVQILKHTEDLEVSVEYVVGHVHTLMAEDQLGPGQWAQFDRQLIEVLKPHSVRGHLIEQVPTTVLHARR